MFTVDPVPQLGQGAVLRELLATVPDWFGRPESNEEYIAFTDTHESWVAVDDATGAPLGLVSGRRHFPQTAEIEVIAVRPELHRAGVGRALVEAFERHHAAAGVVMLEVKTLGPSDPDEGYARTREFYLGMGFIPIEEVDLWGDDTPCLILCKPITR